MILIEKNSKLTAIICSSEYSAAGAIKALNELNLKIGTVKVTVLIETINAVFQMDEFLWELKDHIVGLNAGRWDYLFSTYRELNIEKKRCFRCNTSLCGYAGCSVWIIQIWSSYE